MNRFWLGLVVALLPASALAQSAATGWTLFVDPTEKGFALDVPQGWTTQGGIKRFAPLAAYGWVTTTSPDGTIQVFYGDPEVPAFTLPKAGEAEGATTPAQNVNFTATVALSYRPGAEFGKLYGPRSLAAAGCTGATVTGTQAMPDFARAQYAKGVEAMRGVSVPGYTPPQIDAGSVTFTCQEAGRPLAAGVAAATGQPTAGVWGAVVAGYLTIPGQEVRAQAVLNHMLASRQQNPQWDQAMRDRFQEVLAQQRKDGDRLTEQLLQQQREQGRQQQQLSATLFAKGQADQAALTANHNAFMNQMNKQSEANNQNFKNYQAQRSLNSWNFDAHIRDGELYQNKQTGTIFEVDH